MEAIVNNKELPLVEDTNEITPENHPEMHRELCSGCEEGENANA